MRTTVRRQLLASTIICSLAAAAVPAFAQDAPQDPAAVKAEEEATEGSVSELVVVGSRIRRDSFNSSQPITVITREDTLASGFSSAGDALQSVAFTGGGVQVNGAFGGLVTAGGPGANTISLRGLGPTRTLVLINGRRVAPSGTRGGVGSADLNVLPSAMVDRFEVLLDGASSIYGSDAIAGVVNIITRPKVEGITVESQYNKPAESGGEQFRFAVVGGLSGDRWNISGSAEYYERMDLTWGDRDFTRCQTAGFRSNDFIDPRTGESKCYPTGNTGENGVSINTIGTQTIAGVGAPGSVGTSFNRWRPNSAINTGLIGFEGVGGGANNINVRDTFDPLMLNQNLIQPLRTYTVYAQGDYQLGMLGNGEAYFEVLGTKRQSEQTGYRQLTLDYRLGSPLIPANLAGSNFGPDQGTSEGQRVGVRGFIGWGNYFSRQEADFYKATVGIRGDFSVLPDWRYDVTLMHSDSDADYYQESFLTDRVTWSMNAVAAPTGFDPALVRGGLTCAVNITDPNQRCIVAPVLNTATIAGDLPQDYKDYIVKNTRGNTQYRETVFSAVIDGPIYELPAGTVQMVFGGEYRWQKINDQPDPESVRTNLYNLTSAAPTVGSDEVGELFTEIEVPIIRDMQFVKDLTINGSARYTNYKSYGDDWTYKVSGIYVPVDFLSFRASYGTSYRAPALFEQYQGGTSGFLASTNDPCNNYGVNANPNRRANCASELPGQPTFQATSSVGVITQGGADTGLFAETSKNLTVGAVFEPPLPEEIGRFSLSMDYFDIEVNDGVQQLGAGTILTTCYNDPAFRSGGGFCNLVTRNPNTNALRVINSYTNVATRLLKGIDYKARYTNDIGPGTLTMNLQLTQIHRSTTQLFETDALVDSAGTLPTTTSASLPEWSGTFDASYTVDKWRVRWGVEWVGDTESYSFFGIDPATSEFNLDVPDYLLHNASIRYADADLGFSATLGVRNLFDQDPPDISAGFTNRIGNAPIYASYDYIGRQFFLNVSKSF